ncbi:MAG: hypothetical protein COW24_00900 [Candidatus Kerfeldbacteria bacterium CG15_BIG_FIL_POST_REV_8_21_14_020_45_12]|uniref:Inositol-1-monophosphatase n=1 Tax=Candidatus Kerfeldbacteria bacterium CG15_BIG_FIL_POST_REV_8_21_14_020_45_12 TaxID=2014247 RepID=A0A2M7H4Y6_9BACT|nr:MAG: hypothetical protein COW24_00900 [Candidatus Kerfeldbacteria bacterium CG15_BIG_FIL_POST_REV_8_21_14_020_45_12]PJA93522.1 MAG: hypothetical protein CO132_02730 [Candidatus Kerfeldbacteria bacterium CG_4_9_14_3_um_filter_45_8]
MPKHKPRELTVALQAARAAETVVMKYWRSRNTEKTKSNWRDPVTQADLASDKIIRQILHRAFPTHNILSEEAAQDGSNSDWLWVIDPIDGTVNFTMGLPTFTVSIGLLHKGKPFLGVISAPALDELYIGVTGQGAWMHRKHEPQVRLATSKTTSLKQATFSMGFGYSDAQRQLFLKQFPTLLLKSRAARIHYSATFDLMNVARGGLDFYINTGISLWDYAAAWTIVQESGGQLLTTLGKPITMGDANIIAINGPIKRSLYSHIIK